MRIPPTLLCISVLLFSSCNIVCVQGDGNIVTENRDETGFSGVNNSLSATVYLKQGKDYAVRVDADKNIQEMIRTSVEGGNLVIEMQDNSCISNTSITIYVTTPKVKELRVSGSGEIIAQENISARSLDLHVSGSGEIKLDDVEAKKVESSISGSGELHLSGEEIAKTMAIDISGSGEVHAFGFRAKKVTADISGSGEAELNPLDELNATVSGSGDIYYRKKPKSFNTSISGSGSVSKK